MIPYTCLQEFEFILDSYLYKLDVNFSSSLTLLELSQNCFYNFRRVDCILNGCIRRDTPFPGKNCQKSCSIKIELCEGHHFTNLKY